MTKMSASERYELLRSLSCAFGVSGDEKEVMGLLEKALEGKIGNRKDRFGNRIFFDARREDVPRVLFAAHADEVGFMVQALHPLGYLSLVPVGSWSPLAVVGMAVQVKGKAGLVDGVIGAVPPHHRSDKKQPVLPGWDEIWADVGARNEKQARDVFGIRPGDRVQPLPVFRSLAKGRVLMGKAWDDRVGCALLTELLLESAGKKLSCNLMGVATVQEEVGSRGAQVVAHQVEADAAVILEGAPADDFPSASWQGQAVMGKGVQIRSFDPSMMGNPGFRDFLIEIAEKGKIPYQLAVRRSGGTDGGALHRSGIGIPSVVLAVPVRYAHNGVGLIHLDDYRACLRLGLSAVAGLTKRKLAGFLP